MTDAASIEVLTVEEFARLLYETSAGCSQARAVREYRVLREQLEAPRARKLDWSLLTAREVYEALRSAPKVAGPWERAGIGFAEGNTARKDRDGHVVAIDYGLDDVTTLLRPGRHATRASADAALRAAGWLLVDDDATPAGERGEER